MTLLWGWRDTGVTGQELLMPPWFCLNDLEDDGLHKILEKYRHGGQSEFTLYCVILHMPSRI